MEGGKGDLISVHDRLMVRNQTSYHLDDYMPLLEKRPRAVFDAAPVKQNIPAEVLDQQREQKPSRDHVLGLLHCPIIRYPIIKVSNDEES